VARACGIPPSGLAEAVARQFALRTWDDRTPPDRAALKLLPESSAPRYQALPVSAVVVLLESTRSRSSADMIRTWATGRRPL